MDKRNQRFAAKLLFQYRVEHSDAKRLICEERTVLLQARSAKEALAKATKRGPESETTPRNSDSNFHIEFIGVVDLLHLGIACDEDEVWYEIKQLLEPMKRREKLIRPDRELLFRGRKSDAEFERYDRSRAKASGR